jgi:hypothetical protein
MSRVRRLEDLWRLNLWNQAVSREEHESVMYQFAVRQLQETARDIIESDQAKRAH